MSILNNWDLRQATGKFSNEVESIDDLDIGDGCSLTGMNSLKSVPPNLPLGCLLRDMPDDVDLSRVKAKSEAEIAILDAIPPDRCRMPDWHCGTSHCLAGWAQVLSGKEEDSDKAYKDGLELLPSVSCLFFASTPAVRKWLRKKQYK